ncbi:hypothetical protein [Nocardiopsis baichengensis]|nr:hypothetical protein [Nocardiopsis baichengensis]
MPEPLTEVPEIEVDTYGEEAVYFEPVVAACSSSVISCCCCS